MIAQNAATEEARLAHFFENRKAFSCSERILTTKGKKQERVQNASETIFILPSLADDIGAAGDGKVFAHETVSKLASYCEACESTCNGYGRNKLGAITKQVVATCVKMQHSSQYLIRLIDALVANRANHTDFVALLRHRCIKLPLDILARKLAANIALFGNVLRYYINGFGSDEFCQSPKEQRKAGQVVLAMLACPALGDEFDKSNGRLLFDAVLSPFTKAARHIINDKRVAWSESSAAEIARAMKEYGIFEETRLYLLNMPRITAQLDAEEQAAIECNPAVERFHMISLPFI